MRILHLIDHGNNRSSGRAEAGGEAAMIACRSLIEHTPEHEHAVCLIGPTRTRAAARAHGLCDQTHLPAPMNRPMLARWALGRLIADRETPDLVHSWSVDTLSLQQGLLPSVSGVATLFEHPSTNENDWQTSFRPTGIGGRWLGRALERSPVVVLCETSKRAWIKAFPTIRSVRVSPAPAVAAVANDRDASTNGGGPINTDARAAFRCHHGIADRDLVLLLLGQTPAQADAMRFLFLLDVLHVSCPGIVGLVSSGASQIARGLRFQAQRNNSWRVFVSDHALPELLSVADLAVYAGGRFAGIGNDTTPNARAAVQIRLAHRMGVPVVAPRAVCSSALYTPDAEEACVAFNAALPELARKLLPLHRDRGLLKTIAIGVASAATAIDGRAFAATVEEAWAEAKTGCRDVSARAVTLGA